MTLRDLGTKLTLGRLRSARPLVAVVPLSGIIGQIGPLRRGLTLAGLAGPIERAFGMRNLKAVALAINSPGGSAVQSALIHRRIRSLAAEKDVPVITFAEDVAASGGYWLACAGDEIYVDESSIIGSIGVITAGFGLQGLIERFGVKRRLYTAGEKKSLLDPFLSETADDVARLKAIQGDVHESFKALVRGRRADKLKGEEAELFSGEFWTGRRAVELGLVDGIGDLRTVMRERFGEQVKFRHVSTERGLLRRRLRLAESAGAPGDWASEAIAAVEERVWWGRYGL